MIKVENIVKKFNTITILKGINIQFNDFQIVTITGKSGAGKTTLLQIIGSLLKPSEGKVFIDDIDIFKLNDKELSKFRNKNIGFVFQFHNLLPEFNALENVMMPALIAKKNFEKSKKRAQELLDYFGLSERFNHKPSELSGGEAQRVAVARALMNDPKIILADEPSGNLDTANKEELHKLFFKLRDEFNKTFIIVTHDEQLAAISDRTIKLQDGQIVADKLNIT